MIIDLFWSFLQIGLFSIGGGYAALPLIRQQVTQAHTWMTMAELNDLIVLAESTPGPIAINASTFVGCRMAGLPGGVVATVACVLPACVITLILARVYAEYHTLNWMRDTLATLRPAVVGLIAAAGLSIISSALWGGTIMNFAFRDVKIVSVVLCALAFLALRKWKVNAIYLILGAGVANLGFFIISG